MTVFLRFILLFCLIQYSGFTVNHTHEYMILKTEIGIKVIYRHVYLVWIVKSWFDSIIDKSTKVNLLYNIFFFIIKKLGDISTANVSIWKCLWHFCTGTKFTYKSISFLIWITMYLFFQTHIKTDPGALMHVGVVAFQRKIGPWYINVY